LEHNVTKLANETRQLEIAAFPVGIALGTIGALIWPTLFPNKTTTTTTTTTTRAPVVAGAVGAAIGAASPDDLGTVRNLAATLKLKFTPQILYPDFVSQLFMC
jgi:hypothetical protein